MATSSLASDSDYGKKLLNQYWSRTSAAWLGRAGFDSFLGNYTDSQIQGIGAIARLNPSVWDKVLAKAAKEYPTGAAPSRAWWNSAFLELGAEISTTKVIGDALTQTANDFRNLGEFGIKTVMVFAGIALAVVLYQKTGGKAPKLGSLFHAKAK